MIANNAVSETTPVLVKLTGINYVDATAPDTFQFYLVIEPATAPTWREAETLTMLANSTFDMHQIVDADSIALQSGPTGSSVSEGVLAIGTTGGSVVLRATKGSLTSDLTVAILIVQESDPSNFSDAPKYSTEIAGIDVSQDVLRQPSVALRLDDTNLNEYEEDDIELTLKSDDGNGYKYTDGIAGNFWETNSLTPGGYQERIDVYIDSEIGGTVVSHLLCSGNILDSNEDFGEMTVVVECVDASVNFREAVITNFGRLEKWDVFRQQSDEATYQGVYVPEGALPPIQPLSGSAWEHRTQLTLTELPLKPEGVSPADTAHLTNAELQTAGGFLNDLPIVKFNAVPRAEDIRAIINQIAQNETIYNTHIDIQPATLSDPYTYSRGSVPFSVERTRNTRLLTDWVYSEQGTGTLPNRVLMLLHDPEGHIADQIVQYNIANDSYRTLYTFAKDVKAHRIARRTATDYYILTSDAVTQDRSAATLPRVTDKTGYAYDSIAEGSRVRIHRFNASTNTLTEHVAEDDARPPQLGRHYHAGFENTQYTDEFEGVVPYDRGAFKWQGSYRYYRYATTTEFGIARVGTNGTTSERIDQATGDYHNHLNFAFDLNTSGDLFFVYATGGANESSLVIKRRTSSGTESTLLTDTEALDALTDLDDTGGAYLGALECLIHGNYLHIIAPIQRVDEDSGTHTRSREKSAGCVLYRVDVSAATPALEVIETYGYAQRGVCNLTVHDGAVLFVEHPPAVAQFRPINPDLDGYWSDEAETQTLGYNVLPDPLGALKRIESNGDVTDLGNLWFEEQAYNVAASRAISFDDDLHVAMGYGDPRGLLKLNAGAADPDNFIHIGYGTKLRYEFSGSASER